MVVQESPTWHPKLEAAIALDEAESQVKLDHLLHTAEHMPTEKTDTAWESLAPEIDQLQSTWSNGTEKILSSLSKTEPKVASFLGEVAQVQNHLQILTSAESPSLTSELLQHLQILNPYLNPSEQAFSQTILEAQHAGSGLYLEDIIVAARQLSEALDKSTTKWQMLVQSQLIPEMQAVENIHTGEQVDYFDEISFWLRLQSVLNTVDAHIAKNRLSNKERSSLRAKAITTALPEYISFLSPSITLDVLEGRSDSKDPWLTDRVTVLLTELAEELQTQEKKYSPLQKRLITVAVAALLGTVIATTFNTQLQEMWQNIVEPDKTEQVTETETAQEEEPLPTELPMQENYNTPENSGEFPEGTAWEIQGDVPSGYFRMSTATRFFTNPQWETDRAGGSRYMLTNRSDLVVTTIVSTAPITRPGTYPIPIPYEGYYPTTVELEGAVYEIHRYDNDTYALFVREVSSPQTVSIGLAQDLNHVVYDTSTERHLDNSSLIPDISRLPTEAQEAIAYASSLPDDQGATYLANFVKHYFVYSLDPTHSEYHRAERSQGEYIWRVFQRPFGDCDVVNTVLVGMLRAAGIPSRMAYGYSNSDGFLDPSRDSLDNAESHGWVEYFNGTEWVQLDGTPYRVDEYTAERLKDLNGGGGIGEVIGVNDLKQLLQLLFYSFLSFGDWFRDYGVLTSLLSTFSGSVVGGVGNHLVRNRQRSKISDIREMLTQARLPYSTASADIHMINILTDEDLDVQFWHEKKSHSFKVFMADWLSVLPMLIVNIRRGRKIKAAERGITSMNLDSYSSDEFVQFITQALNLEPKLVSRKIVELNSLESTRACTDRHFTKLDRAQANLKPSIYFGAKGQKYTHDETYIEAQYKKSEDLNTFLVNVTKGYYDGYVDAWHKLKKENSRKKSKSPLDKTPNKMNFDEFAKFMHGSLVPLTFYWEHCKARDAAIVELSEKKPVRPSELETNLPRAPKQPT